MKGQDACDAAVLVAEASLRHLLMAAAVHELGDRWLELKVLRDLERGYLAAPNQSRCVEMTCRLMSRPDWQRKCRVARASLDIKEKRRRDYEAAVTGDCVDAFLFRLCVVNCMPEQALLECSRTLIHGARLAAWLAFEA